MKCGMCKWWYPNYDRTDAIRQWNDLVQSVDTNKAETICDIGWCCEYIGATRPGYFTDYMTSGDTCRWSYIRQWEEVFGL